MKVAVAFSVLAMAAAIKSRAEYEAQFAEHVATYNLELDGAEWVERLKIFIEHDVKIAAHNADEKKTFTMAHNKFSHLTVEEWRDMYTGLRRPNLRMPGGVRKTAEELGGVAALPTSVDWRTQNAVTPVKDQGQCGSCWSFSTTGGLEGAFAIKTGSLVSFAEQQLVDCSSLNSGCNGGMMDRADRFIRSNGGLCTEADYPYVSGVTETAGTCQTSCSLVAGSKVSSWTDLDNSNDALLAALAQQPVSVAVDAEGTFQHYSGGVLTGTCGTSLDHGVLAVGYGTDPQYGDYWLVKNSWGTSWGEAGYIRLGRVNQPGGQCGITSAASFVSL